MRQEEKELEAQLKKDAKNAADLFEQSKQYTLKNDGKPEEFDVLMKDTIRDTLQQMREMEAKEPPKQMAKGAYKIDPALGDRLWREAQQTKQ